MGLTLAQLHLHPIAEQAARRLLVAYPFVQFTSGRRDLAAQARAMVTNERIAPGFIRATYKAGAPFADYVERHRTSLTWDELEQGVLQLLVHHPRVEDVSRHLSGLAFDLHPLIDRDGLPTQEGYAMLDWIRRHLCPATLLLREGGLTRWHVDFIPPVGVPV